MAKKVRQARWRRAASNSLRAVLTAAKLRTIEHHLYILGREKYGFPEKVARRLAQRIRKW